jgi:polar amino acid transport system substrate-binding protein
MGKLGSIGAVLVGVAVLSACGRSDAPEPEASAGGGTPDCQLTMGWDSWEPYHFLTPTGEMHGFDIQLVRTIGERAGCEIDFVRDSWAALLAKVASGEIDLISGATLTPERETFAYFSEPYRSEDFMLYVRSGELDTWAGNSLRELLASGMRIGVTDSYIYGDEVTALQDDTELSKQFTPAAVGDVNASRLLDGVIDGFIEDIFVATATIRRRGLENQIAVHPLALQSGGQVRFMFSRASTSEDIVARFNEALAQIEASGAYQEIEDRYLR